jgi:hypothetical protein
LKIDPGKAFRKDLIRKVRSRLREPLPREAEVAPCEIKRWMTQLDEVMDDRNDTIHSALFKLNGNDVRLRSGALSVTKAEDLDHLIERLVNVAAEGADLLMRLSQGRLPPGQITRIS